MLKKYVVLLQGTGGENKPVMRKKRNVTLEHATMECADNANKLADTGCTQTHTHTHTHTHTLPSHTFTIHTFAIYLLLVADFI